MRNIVFLGSTNIEFGRGKDKKKRTKRNYLLGVGTGAAIGGTIGLRAGENKFVRGMYKLSNKGANPTSTNINAIRKNLQKYKIGQGSASDDVVKEAFKTMRVRSGLRNALRGAALGSAVVGGSMLVKRLRNKKTLKIAGKAIKIKGKTLTYQKSD